MVASDTTISVWLSVLLHIIGAAALGWMVSSTLPEAPARLVFTTIDIELSEAVVTAASGAAAASEAVAPNRERVPQQSDTPPQRSLPQEVYLAPESDTSPRLQSQQPVPEVVMDETTPSEREAFEPDYEVIAELTEIDTIPSASSEGAGDSQAGGFDAVDSQPAARAVIRPVYPIGARRRGEEGRVVVEVTVLANGHTEAAEVVTSSGFAEIDRAAEKALSSARFAPATRGGDSVASRVRLTFIFRLRDK